MSKYYNSNIYPVKGKKIRDFDKHSKYIVKVLAPTDLSESLFEYSKCFCEAAHIIKDYIINETMHDIAKLSTYIFSIAFLYRHCLELGLKAIGFQYISSIDKREQFVKETRHNLTEILDKVINCATYLRPEKELVWLKDYFDSLSIIDKESDSFRYPFHIAWTENGKVALKEIFDRQINIDLPKFAIKFEASYEIIEKWYKQNCEKAVAWESLKPIFLEEGGNYYTQSVVGYQYNRYSFFPYTKAYLETANFLKHYMKTKTDTRNLNYNELLFLPMCYLYRNCVELSLKTIWFKDTNEDFQIKCKCMLENKHSIIGMWNKVKPYVWECAKEVNDEKCVVEIEDYCMQIHSLDSDANLFRYPMSKVMQAYFSHNKRFDFMELGNFFESLNNILFDVDTTISNRNKIKAEIESEYYS